MRFINQLITGGHHPVTIWYHYDITMFEHGDVTPHWGNCSKGKRMFVSISGGYFSTNHMCHGARLSPYNWVFISWVITHLPISSTNSLAHLSMIPLQEWEATMEKNNSLLAHVVLQFYPKAATVTGCIMNHVSLWQKMFVFIYFCYLWFSPTTITHAGIDRTWSRPILNQAINYSRMMSTCFCEKAPPQHTNIFPDWAPKMLHFTRLSLVYLLLY